MKILSASPGVAPGRKVVQQTVGLGPRMYHPPGSPTSGNSLTWWMKTERGLQKPGSATLAPPRVEPTLPSFPVTSTLLGMCLPHQAIEPNRFRRSASAVEFLSQSFQRRHLVRTITVKITSKTFTGGRKTQCTSAKGQKKSEGEKKHVEGRKRTRLSLAVVGSCGGARV
jgi:hypothetical protein